MMISYPFLLMAICVPRLSQANLQSKFSHFEVLSRRHIEVRVKRDTHGLAEFKRLTLLVFGRRISLSLSPGLTESLLSPEFKSYAFHANSTKSRIMLDRNDFHQGVINGQGESWVSGVHHEGLWVIYASHPTMSFSVEPLNFMNGSGSNRLMVAYRHRDVKIGSGANQTKDEHFCKHFVHNESQSNNMANISSPNSSTIKGEYEKEVKSRYDDSYIYKKSTNTETNKSSFKKNASNKNITSEYVFENRRKKRDFGPNKVCDLLIIADYRFYKGVGNGCVVNVVKKLIHIYNIVNNIFAKTDFGSKRIGIQIRDVEVYDHPGGNGPEQYFNYETEYPDSSKLLEAITTNKYYGQYCLAHLSTQRTFSNEVLGLAHAATLGELKRRGVCGGTKGHAYNLGMSTVLLGQMTISLMTYSLVVAHEIGHNFGAKHDEEHDPRCSPTNDAGGGKYIMWYAALNNMFPNNQMFSPCSKRQIAEIIEERSPCFKPIRDLEKKCGNGVLDFGEDCDLGLGTLKDTKGCCTSQCGFTPNSTCSPYNHPCCYNCTVAPETQKCVNDGYHQDCLAPSYCDGIRHTCPASSSLPNGHKCKHHGECQYGECIPFCPLVGSNTYHQRRLTGCNCTDADDIAKCSICCQEIGPHKPCKSYGVSYDNGTPCLNGFCINGSCSDVYIDGQHTGEVDLQAKEEEEEEEVGMDLFVIITVVSLVCLICSISLGVAVFRYTTSNIGIDANNPDGL